MGFIKNNATTLKQVKIGTDTSKIHYIKRNGLIEWAKPYNLTISKGSGVNSVSVYRKSTKVSSGVTSGTSATLSSGNQVFHGDVLHIDATAATGYHITSGTGDITVKGAVTINPQVGRNQYKFKFEPRLINTVQGTGDSETDLGYSVITDTSLNLTIPFGYDDNTQPTAVNTTINAVGGSKIVLYNGYLFFTQSIASDSPIYSYYPQVKETNRIMYNFASKFWIGNTKGNDRIGTSDKTIPAYFYKLIGITLTSHLPIPMEITSSYSISSVGSSELSSHQITLESGSSAVLWSDIFTGDGLCEPSYTCDIPIDQSDAWTFDSTGKTSVLTKFVPIASWDVETGIDDSDIPVSVEIPMPTQRLYDVAINVESSINKVILNSADLSTGYLFLGINGSWQPITSPTLSFSLPHGATIQFAKNHNSNMPGFTYNSDATSQTKTITVNGTSYTVDVYSKSYTVYNTDNMNIPFYVTPNSYTITCNVGTGIRAFNFSTVSKYGTSHENNTYGGGSFTVYYKDTCSYSGLVDTGFENPVPSATNEPVSTKTITFTASPKLFRVTVSMGSATGITATFDRTSSPYKGAATGTLKSGYDNNNLPLGNSGGITFGNGWSFDAYYGDVFICTPTFKVTTPTNASLTMQTKYINFTSSRTISEATTWSIVPKESNITVYFTNTKFFNSDSQYLKYCRHGTYTSSQAFSAGTNKAITIDAGTPVYMYTCCRRNQNPGNSSNVVTNLGSNNPGAYVGTCYSQYSTSLTMSSFSKITALPYNNDYIEVVPAKKKESGEFYLTLAPIIKMFTRGYGIAGTSGSTATNVTAYEYQYSGSSMTGQYEVPHQEVAEVHKNVTNYTTCITTMAVLHSGTTRLGAKWNVWSGVAGKVSFDNSPADFINFKTFDELLFKNDDRNIPDGTVVTYGPYASVKIKPYLDTYYYSWGWKYALYHGTERTFRTYRRKYDGTSNLPSMGYNASGSGSVSNLGTYLYYSGPTESIPTVRGYLEAGGGSSMYDNTSVSLSRSTFLSSSTGSNPNKYSLSGTKSYAILDFNSTSNKIESKLKAVLDDKLVIDYVYDYKTNNY